MLISPSLSPNITAQDVRLSIKLLLQPWNWRSSISINLLTGTFSNFLSVPRESIFAVNSARAGISDILSLYNIGEGDEVIVQGFTCVAVTNSVRWVGATPIIVDIDEHSLNLDQEEVKKHLTKKTKAIIIQHTFGLPFQKIDELIAIAHEKGIIVIEDCAHSLGVTMNGRLVGTFADAGVFSFGRDKIISSVFGGVVVIRDQKKQNEFRHHINSQNDVGLWWIKKQLLHPIVTWISLVTYEWLGFGKVWHFVLQKAGIISKATSREEKNSGPRPEWTTKKYPGVLAQMVIPQLKRVVQNNDRRNWIADTYKQAGITSVQPQVSDRVWLRYSILEDDPVAMKKFFILNGVVLGDWYDQVVAPREVNLSILGYTMGDAPVAERICAHVVNLPTYPRMTDDDVKKVIALYQEYKKQNNVRST